MNLVQSLKTWWIDLTGGEELPIDRETISWLVSLVLHLAVLILLATLAYLIPVQDDFLLSTAPPEVEDLPPITEVEFTEFDPADIGTLGDDAMADAAAAAPERADFSEVLTEYEPQAFTGELPAMDADFTLTTAPTIDDRMLVKGSGNVGTTAASGAVDRITNEILLSLEQRPTLVIWLFDESGSLQPQREEIAQRFQRIYEELGIIEDSGNEAFKRNDDEAPLLTAVASFEANVTIHTKQPTSSLSDVQQAMQAIEEKAALIYSDQNAATGQENVFSAIGKVANQFRRYRTKSPQRNVMIVVFTDEAGNDYQYLDAAVDLCKKSVIPVYVVGVPAPFGRREAFVKYVDPDPSYDQSPQYVPVDQGPESLMAERVQLRYFGRNDEDERLESGFGPFGLSRITYETGGIYFSVHPNRREGHVSRRQTEAMATHIAMFFDPLIMRRYRPDYVSVDEYKRRLAKNSAKASLVQAATLSWTEQMEDIRLRFPKYDEAELARDLTLAQRAAAKLEPKLQQLTTMMKRGESDRDKISEPRWKAGFDLAMGRTLAAKVRTEGYNTMLAMAKQGMKFKNPRNDTWVLMPSDEVSTGSVLSNEADLARMYLERVVAEHEETPWAYLASKELETPFGWQWNETFTNVVARRENQNNNNNNPQPERMPNVPPKKPSRPVPKL
ncbi:vWA domain-containing protein [Aeoliella mucimassa]|uniref:von Willebrand factor type A domain protein n=1 Tax=Aeoliella mucimassa TaxID=2527972 RepID=A0A518AKJ0_9BACT|nr:vWA domain-containing protein [Aeoliella mucimassa]QDU55245.1 von Willebrand factor type A domain protein [Aeoliella mucimassa]